MELMDSMDSGGKQDSVKSTNNNKEEADQQTKASLELSKEKIEITKQSSNGKDNDGKNSEFTPSPDTGENLPIAIEKSPQPPTTTITTVNHDNKQPEEEPKSKESPKSIIITIQGQNVVEDTKPEPEPEPKPKESPGSSDTKRSDQVLAEDNSDLLAEVSSDIGIGLPEKSESGQVGLAKKGHGMSSTKAQPLLDAKNYDKEIAKDIYDVCCLAIICNVHHRIALRKIEANNCFYLPYIRFNQSQNSFENSLKEIFDSIMEANPKRKVMIPQVVDVWRAKYPKTDQNVTRYIFKTIIYCDEDVKSKKYKCQDDDGSVRWFKVDDFKMNIDPLKISTTTQFHFWGLEPYHILKSDDHVLNMDIFHENQSEDFLQNFPQKPANDYSFWQTLVKGAGYEESDLRTLFNEFLSHCYPAETMTFSSFFVFASKLSLYPILNLKQLRMLFISYDPERNHVLTFQNLVTGFTLMESSIANQTEKQQPILFRKRLEYLFRYYDADRDDSLDLQEFTLLINDYHEKLAQHLLDKSSIPGWLKEKPSRDDHCLYLLRKMGTDSSMNFEQFERFMKEFDPTNESIYAWNLLYQLPYDLLNYAGAKFCYTRIFAKSYYSLQNRGLPYSRCAMCASNRFFLSNQLIYLSKLGEIFDIVHLEPFNLKDNEMEPSFKEDIPEKDINLLTNDILIRLQRLGIILFTDQVDFNEPNYDELLNNWFFTNQTEMFDAIRMIVEACTEIFVKEKRVIQIQSPCYVFGDLHGNFKDLNQYSQYLWKCSPFFNTGKYLFLGDYVDRGQWGIEVVIFLFCYKILAPDTFFIIRGNHEIREVQSQFSFLMECKSRLSLELWELFNECFDRMPIAALIDDRIYCAHGGIPASVSTVRQLFHVPTPLPNPAFQSDEAWEVFWNDPINASEWQFLPEPERNLVTTTRGFARNIKRGTAYLYSEEAVDNFCQKNVIDYILRAHEVYHEGFFFYSRGKVITVFSSSKYSFLDNQAAVLFVARNKIRVIKFEDE